MMGIEVWGGGDVGFALSRGGMTYEGKDDGKVGFGELVDFWVF